jgi:phosphohistidine phosphatase
MRAYLVRHGEAKSKEEDPERHLSERGQVDVRNVAELLGPRELTVEAIWHSGKARAEDTAEILASRIGVRDRIGAQDGLSPNDPPGPVREMIERAGGDVMLVGHLPQMNRLLGAMLSGDENAEPAAFEAGAVVCLQQDDGGAWKLAWMIVPSLL